MNLNLQRFSDNRESTLGLIHINKIFEAYSLEDEFHVGKIKSTTRIPAGTYPIRLREDVTPLTQHYRNRFDWFIWHLEIVGIPNFSHVYIHVGNNSEDTDACILVGDAANDNTKEKGFISKSVVAYKDLYFKVVEALEHGEEVTITIKDEIELF